MFSPFGSPDPEEYQEDLDRGKEALTAVLDRIEDGVQAGNRPTIHEYIDNCCQHIDDLPVNRPPALHVEADAEPTMRAERLLELFHTLEDTIEEGNTKGISPETVEELADHAASLEEFTDTDMAPWPYYFSEERTENFKGKPVISHGDSPNNEESVFAGPEARKMIEVHRHKEDRPLWIGMGTRTGRPAGIEKQYLFRHVGIFGVTGYGKSTLLKNNAKQLIESGAGLCFIDPKGDDSEELMEILPPERMDDVIWIEPGSKRSHVSGFNFLDVGVEEDNPNYDTAIENLVDDMVKMLGADDYWGPRMDRVAQNIIRAMARSQYEFNIVDMYFLLASEESREIFAEVVGEECSQFIQAFTREIAMMDQDDLEPLLGRFQSWVENPLARRLIAFRRSNFNISDAVENNKIIIVRMSNEPRDLKMMIGKAVLRRIWATIRSRADSQEHERKPFYLIADEFDNIATADESIPTMLSEARSYRLSITFCTQYPTRLPKRVQEGLFVNADTILSFNPGSSKQARPIADHLGVDTSTLVQESNYHAWMQLTLSGTNELSEAFRVYTLPPYPPIRSYQRAQELIDYKLAECGRERKSEHDQRENLMFNYGGGLLEQNFSISTHDMNPSDPDVGGGGAGASGNASGRGGQSGQAQAGGQPLQRGQAQASGGGGQSSAEPHGAQPSHAAQRRQQSAESGLQHPNGQSQQPQNPQAGEQPAQNGQGQGHANGQTSPDKNPLDVADSVHDLDDEVIDEVLMSIYQTQIKAHKPVPVKEFDEIDVEYRNDAGAADMVDPKNTLVPEDAIVESIEERLGELEYVTKVGNLIELLTGNLISSSRWNGQEYYTMTVDGYSRIVQDSGESGSSGGSEHRFFLRKAFATFTRLGYQVTIPTQEGEEIADAIADPPFDVNEIVQAKNAKRELEAYKNEYPLVFALTWLGQGYIEAETSTPRKPAQFLNNLKKAVNDEKTCIFVCKDGSANKGRFEAWGEKCEKIAYPTTGRGRGKEVESYDRAHPVSRVTDDGDVIYYNRNGTYNTDESDGEWEPCWPKHFGSQRWVKRDGELVLESADTDQEFARFPSVEDYANVTATDFPVYRKRLENGKHLVVAHSHFERDHGDEIKKENIVHYLSEVPRGKVWVWEYDSTAKRDSDWGKIMRPFLPELQYDEYPQPEDFEIIIYPDDDNEHYDQPQLYREGECKPLFDTLAKEVGLELTHDRDVEDNEDSANSLEDDTADHDRDEKEEAIDTTNEAAKSQETSDGHDREGREETVAENERSKPAAEQEFTDAAQSRIEEHESDGAQNTSESTAGQNSAKSGETEPSNAETETQSGESDGGATDDSAPDSETIGCSQTFEEML